MFEKEAEEWTISHVCKDCSRYEECKSKEHCTCKECSKEKWQNGAMFGYDKANEWHNLRKHPDDLPAEGEIVLCYCLGYCGASYPITARMYNNYEDSSIHYWWTLGGEGKSEELSNVLAWKEIIPPRG